MSTAAGQNEWWNKLFHDIFQFSRIVFEKNELLSEEKCERKANEKKNEKRKILIVNFVLPFKVYQRKERNKRIAWQA